MLVCRKIERSLSYPQVLAFSYWKRKISAREHKKLYFRESQFENFLGNHAPRPPERYCAFGTQWKPCLYSSSSRKIFLHSKPSYNGLPKMAIFGGHLWEVAAYEATYFTSLPSGNYRDSLHVIIHILFNVRSQFWEKKSDTSCWVISISYIIQECNNFTTPYYTVHTIVSSLSSITGLLRRHLP